MYKHVLLKEEVIQDTWQYLRGTLKSCWDKVNTDHSFEETEEMVADGVYDVWVSLFNKRLPTCVALCSWEGDEYTVNYVGSVPGFASYGLLLRMLEYAEYQGATVMRGYCNRPGWERKLRKYGFVKEEREDNNKYTMIKEIGG